jgi:flagella basal body P-ring formation protein FlgA
MHLIKAFFLLLLSINLLANQHLQNNYFIKNEYILLSDIIKNPTNDKKIYFIDRDKHSLRIKSKELIKSLKLLGYSDISSKHTYIQFTQESPIDTQKIKRQLYSLYSEYYHKIEIIKIEIHPRSYIESLPKKYTIHLNKKAFLSSQGVLYIKTSDRKKIFFNYMIEAKVTVIKAKEDIARGSELSKFNTQKKSIILDRFRAMPLQELEKSTLQTKLKIKKSSVLTLRDVVRLDLIKRGSSVNVSIIDRNLAVTFTAKASQNGRYGDIIYVINKNGKKIKVLVTGKNRAEIR